MEHVCGEGNDQMLNFLSAFLGEFTAFVIMGILTGLIAIGAFYDMRNNWRTRSVESEKEWDVPFWNFIFWLVASALFLSFAIFYYL
jgi:hypothetical protein